MKKKQLKWEKPTPDREFLDGEKLLVAIFVHNIVTEKSAYEYYIVRVMCDSESPVYFVHDETNDPFDEWDWEDVDWFISTSD